MNSLKLLLGFGFGIGGGERKWELYFQSPATAVTVQGKKDGGLILGNAECSFRRLVTIQTEEATVSIVGLSSGPRTSIKLYFYRPRGKFMDHFERGPQPFLQICKRGESRSILR